MPYTGALSAMCVYSVIRNRIPSDRGDIPKELSEKIEFFRKYFDEEWGALSNDCFWYVYNVWACEVHPSDALEVAGKNGNVDFLRMCYKWGARKHELGMAMIEASENGHTEFVGLCHSSGGNALDKSARSAMKNGHWDIVRLCLGWGAIDVDYAMCKAAREGHEDIVRTCFERGATDVDDAMNEAAKGGHRNIVRMLHDEFGATDISWVTKTAIRNGHEEIVRMCIEWEIVDLERD